MSRKAVKHGKSEIHAKSRKCTRLVNINASYGLVICTAIVYMRVSCFVFTPCISTMSKTNGTSNDQTRYVVGARLLGKDKNHKKRFRVSSCSIALATEYSVCAIQQTS